MTHSTSLPRLTWAPALLLAATLPIASLGAQGSVAPSPGSRAAASTSVLPGEFRAAPIVFSPAGPLARGRVVGYSGNFETFSFAETDQFQFQDLVYVDLPGGASLGASYVVVDSVTTLPGGGIVMQPTGVVRVERTADGQASTARVVEQFAPMRVGQIVLPMDATPAPTPRPTPVSEPVTASVVWRPSTPALPGTLQWMVLEVAEGASYAPGDRLSLVRPPTRSAYGTMLPEEVLGEAIVVRTSPHGVTALLIDVNHGAITEGTVARRSARGS